MDTRFSYQLVGLCPCNPILAILIRLLTETDVATQIPCLLATVYDTATHLMDVAISSPNLYNNYGYLLFCSSRNTVVVWLCYDIHEVSTVNKARSLQKSTIATFGFSVEKNKIINSHLTKSTMELFEAEYATDLLAIDHLMIIVNVSGVSNKDLQQLLSYYNEVSVFSEAVILVGDCKGLAVNNRVSVYAEFDDLQRNLKYLLLAAHKQKKSAESFSRSISYALMILKIIAENPGISSKEISDKLEISSRSVTRYIETLNMSGESIVYNRKKNGWSLEYDESLLKL